MKTFEEPIIEVMNMSVVDVITTSGEGGDTPAVIPPCA